MKDNKNVTIKIRLNNELKEQAMKELNAIGVTMSDAVRLYLSYIIKKKRIPPEFTDNS
ncbi:MAG: type II toxin-antitoxin system RelB/DinJ family antitoxin [Haemophilus parainfluenzae]|jgi:hypothetical protein